MFNTDWQNERQNKVEAALEVYFQNPEEGVTIGETVVNREKVMLKVDEHLAIKVAAIIGEGAPHEEETADTIEEFQQAYADALNDLVEEAISDNEV